MSVSKHFPFTFQIYPFLSRSIKRVEYQYNFVIRLSNSGYRDIPVVHVFLLHGLLRHLGDPGGRQLPDLPAMGEPHSKGKVTQGIFYKQVLLSGAIFQE